MLPKTYKLIEKLICVQKKYQKLQKKQRIKFLKAQRINSLKTQRIKSLKTQRAKESHQHLTPERVIKTKSKSTPTHQRPQNTPKKNFKTH